MKSCNALWMRGALGAILAGILAPISAVAVEAKPDAAGIEFFEKKIRPLLAANCFTCHSAGKKRRGNLLLDSRAGLLKGGDNGPALVPGDPDKSLLVKAISYKDELRMPPRSKLSDVQIADLTAWVKRGAPWPGGDGAVAGPEKFDFEKRRRHWSLQPVGAAVPPLVKEIAWAGTPIDRFLLAKLKARGLSPAGRADRSTLLRRVTYDLTGLPPTPDEIRAFQNDPSANAWEKVIDRLLASPAYGERWGRHWLDLMRFAETSGHEFDFEIPHAHLYRDYVVRTFNEDVPYDRIVQEHIAGDLMPGPRRRPVERTNESVLGTGFWFLGESKHSPVDVRADGSDRRDNMIDVFGKTFLGLTISCARCHDHKFDAIYTKDYYSLAGYLQSSRMQRAFLDEPERIGAPARKIRELRAEAGALATRLAVAALEAKLSGLAAALEAARKGAPSPIADALKRVDLRQAGQLFRPWRILGDPALPTDAAFLAKKRELLLQFQGMARQADEAGKRYVRLADFQKSGYREWFLTGHAFGDAPAGVDNVEVLPASPVPVARVIGQGVASSGLISTRLQGALRSRTFTIEKKHLLYHARGRGVRINVIIDGFQQIRIPIYGGLTFTVNDDNPRWYVQNLGMWVGQKAYIEVLDDDRGSIELDQVLFSDASAPPPDRPNSLLVKLVEDASPESFARAYQKLLRETLDLWRDGKLSEKEDSADRIDLLNATLSSAVISALPAAANVDRTRPSDAALTRDSASQLTKLLQAVTAAEAALPEPTRGLALTDGTGVNERVSIRGNHKTPGEEAPRRLLVALGGDQQPLPAAGSGRLELAKRLTFPDNPLLARVMVNRLWHHHFGAGVVRSVDNFGIQGEAPTHPELLDWLAMEFMRSGWSIKHMHRLILRSSAYQMQSKSDDASNRADPRNELLHRMSIRRMEAEAVRDAMLAVSGRLDRVMFGRGPLPYLTPFMIGRGRPGGGPLDGAGRRSIYLNVRRNFLNPMFLAFDYPVPFTTIGRRSVSNVPAQALTLLNNPLVMQQARLWAERMLASPARNSRERVEMMYEIAYGRKPVEMELTEALDFLTEQGKEYGREDVRAWADLAHVMFNVKEFVFVN